MADIGDVLNAAKTLVLDTLYPPSGVVPSGNVSPVAGCAVLAENGWPIGDTLDMIAASVTSSPQQAVVSLFAAPGTWRNTTRYPLRWQRQIAASTTLTVMIDGTVATIGGTVSAPQNVALLVGFGANRTRPFVYSVQSADTLDSIAAALAALVNSETPATASGAAVTIPAAYYLAGRVGGFSTVVKEVMRQTARIWVDVRAPLPTVRDAVASPVKAAFADAHFLTLVDGFGARLITRGDGYLDDAEKAGIYRRLLLYDVEYATTVTEQAPVAIVLGTAEQGGAGPTGNFTPTIPPVVETQS